jgi:hypothetical protein
MADYYKNKYRYLLYRIQQALIEMDTDPKTARGRRQLTKGLYACEGTIFPTDNMVTHEEMRAIEAELFKNKENEDSDCEDLING